MSVRDSLRALTIGSTKHFKRTTVTIDGNDFEVRSPSVKQRAAIFKMAGVSDKDKQPDIAALQAAAVIELTYVPGTEERVFSDKDYAAIYDSPAGSWVDELAEVAMGTLNVKKDAVEGDGGN